ncbi:excitatory amino acid transporter 1-like isoform X1 [Dermacentor albipictus]|uniref:excitatory amino acid transporter 1-like isoform X1 n=1 Tax=Dermacentor albipictus TaxID=60249 RepID=UPI0031FBE83B
MQNPQAFSRPASVKEGRKHSVLSLKDQVPLKASPIPAFLMSWTFSLLILLGLGLGLALGAVERARFNETAQHPVFYVDLPGRLFFQAMNMLAPFMEVCSVAVAVARLGPSLVAKALSWSALFLLTTQCTAHVSSFALTSALQPGQQARPLLVKLPVKPTSTDVVYDALLVFLRSMFPKSIVDAFIFTWGETTVGTAAYEEIGPGIMKAIPGFNSYGLISFSLLFGLVLGERFCDDEDIVFDILEGFTSALLRISQLLAWTAPISLGSIAMAWIFRVPDISEFYGHLSSFIWVVLLAFLIQLFIVLPCIYGYVGKVDGRKFIRRVFNAMFIPLTTTSSQASVPLTIAYLESSELLDIRLVRLLVPVFACMRKDASGAVRLSLTLSVVQAQHAQLTVAQSIFLVFTASLAGIMAYGYRIEEANLISHLVLNSLPIMEPKDVPFDLAAILLDPLLSLMNIAGDCVGVAVVQSVMYRDLSVEPSGLGGFDEALPTAHPVAAVTSSECDVSCEPYFRSHRFPTPMSSEQDDVPQLFGPPAAKEWISTPPPVQAPTPKEPETLPSPVQPPTTHEQDNLCTQSSALVAESRCQSHT